MLSFIILYWHTWVCKGYKTSCCRWMVLYKTSLHLFVFFKSVAENHISSWATASHDGWRVVSDHISYYENSNNWYAKYMRSYFSRRNDNMPFSASQSDLHGACSVFTVSSKMVNSFFSFFLRNSISLKQLFKNKIEIICWKTLFSVTLNNFNASLLNESINVLLNPNLLEFV